MTKDNIIMMGSFTGMISGALKNMKAMGGLKGMFRSTVGWFGKIGKAAANAGAAVAKFVKNLLASKSASILSDKSSVTSVIPKILSDKQIASGFGGKAAKDALLEKSTIASRIPKGTTSLSDTIQKDTAITKSTKGIDSKTVGVDKSGGKGGVSS